MYFETTFKKIDMEYGTWNVCPKVDLHITAEYDKDRYPSILTAFADVYHPETGELYGQIDLDLSTDWPQFKHLETEIASQMSEYEYEQSHWYDNEGGSNDE